MPDWLKVYGETEGPLGFPMKDADALRLEETLKAIGGEPDYQRMVVEKAMTEVCADGERADVSWICTESVDRHKEVVLINGFNDEQFKANPIVTLNHDYTKYPVGKSIWRKKIRNQHYRGIKAKTIYPGKPDDWNNQEVWAPDKAFQLVQSGLMTGKSIGFLTLKSHAPTADEVVVNPEWKKVSRVIDEWILLEYCCCWLPVNPDAIVEAVSKSADITDPLKWAGADIPEKKTDPIQPPEPETIIPILSLEEAEAIIHKRLTTGIEEIAKKLVQDALDKAQGRI